MNNFKIFLIIFSALAFSRFLPHPPNFTSLIALSFYTPFFFGIRTIPIVLISFAITDYFIGYHNVLIFTWGSVILIGLLSNYFFSSIKKRILGAVIGACVFYIVTNFGVWTFGTYGYSFGGLMNCYMLAIPFFGYTLLSTLFFSTIIEIVYKIYIIYLKKLKLIN